MILEITSLAQSATNLWVIWYEQRHADDMIAKHHFQIQKLVFEESEKLVDYNKAWAKHEGLSEALLEQHAYDVAARLWDQVATEIYNSKIRKQKRLGGLFTHFMATMNMQGTIELRKPR
jgi:hypothetical protein